MTEKPAATNSSVVKQKPRNKGFALAAIFLIVFSTLIGYGLYNYYRDRITTDDAQIDGHLVTISAKVYGSVEKVFIVDNQSVQAGDTLVQIDPRDLQAKVNQASASLDQVFAVFNKVKIAPDKAETVLSRAIASLSRAKFTQAKFQAQLEGATSELTKSKVSFQQAKSSDLKVAEANVESRKAVYEKAKSDLSRMKPLADRQEISKQQLDSYETAAEVAESDLKAAQRRLASAKQEAEIRGSGINSQQAKISQAEAEVEQAKAEVEQAKADVDQAKVGIEQAKAEVEQAKAEIEQAKVNLDALLLQLSYTTIKAPVDGYVTARTVEVGQNIQPGQGLMVLVSPNHVWVTANFKETQLRDVRPGQLAEVYVDLSGTTLHGKVDSISGATGARMSLLPPENAIGNFVKVVQRIPVKIILDPAEIQKEVLRPGMNVDTTIFVSDSKTHS
ncbi:MAG: HlyD family secretion protein [Candidatus Riflebacteria bacterium]|nr:HlyD family secretion protein [Candidatus Riflebacteria bacterium]